MCFKDTDIESEVRIVKIHEAVEKSLKEKKPITRTSLSDFGFKIFPTDSSDCCYLIPKDEKQQPARCWNPTADDLLADDWEVVGGDTKSEQKSESSYVTKRELLNQMMMSGSRCTRAMQKADAALTWNVVNTVVMLAWILKEILFH